MCKNCLYREALWHVLSFRSDTPEDIRLRPLKVCEVMSQPKGQK